MSERAWEISLRSGRRIMDADKPKNAAERRALEPDAYPADPNSVEAFVEDETTPLHERDLSGDIVLARVRKRIEMEKPDFPWRPKLMGRISEASFCDGAAEPDVQEMMSNAQAMWGGFFQKDS